MGSGEHPQDADALGDLVARALVEDVGEGDATSESVVPAGTRAAGSILQKEPGVLFGLDAVAEVFRQTGAEGFDPMMVEGQWREGVPATVARVSGSAGAVLGGERVALNLLGHLSGIATLTARFAEEVRGSGATILDTRKTTPGMRFLEKAAVAAGGGANHRMGLYDSILIKDNHITLAGGVGEAVRRAKESGTDLSIEVECDNADQIRQAIDAGASRILLDNMSIDDLRASVAIAREADPAPKLEASGGITLETVAQVAATGVDFISVGALTHSAPSLDLSFDVSFV